MPLPLWLTLVWLFVLGTIVGSFLNVVVYRLPRGLSIVHPGSRCPACNHPIRWYDNVPIIGWLFLRGHCRDCGSAISVRYPLVELSLGLMFLAVGWNDWVRPQQIASAMAAAQPAQQVAAKSPEEIAQAPETGLYVWRTAYHLLLLCSLLAATLIDADCQRVPRRLITWPAGAGILIAMFWPAVQIFPLVRAEPGQSGWINLAALATSFIGMLAAFVLQLAVLRYRGVIRAREAGLLNCTLALTAVGAFLGWQAVLLTGGFALVWAFYRGIPQLKPALLHVRPTAVLFIGTLVWCLSEHQLLMPK
jgi:leader peptidase (prepilin peptidase) / N-methyltransferase